MSYCHCDNLFCQCQRPQPASYLIAWGGIMTDEPSIYATPVARTVGVDFPSVRLAPRSLRRRITGRRVTLFIAHSEVSRDP